MKVIASQHSAPRRVSSHALAACGLILVLIVCLRGGQCPASEIWIVPDERTAPAVQHNTALHPSSSRDERKEETPHEETNRADPGHDKETNQFLKMRRLMIERYEPQRREEDRLMEQVVRMLDREAASQWLASFISCAPLNCSLAHQAEWIDAIIAAVERNGLPVCKEALGLVACIVAIESGFRADPKVVDRSRGETVAAMLDRAEQELFDRMGSLMAVPPVPQLYDAYREKYRPLLLTCRTEGDIEGVANRIADDLKVDAARLPGAIRKIVYQKIDRLKNVVRTKGSMQLNFARARQVTAERGDHYTDQDLTNYLYTVKGGVDVGVAALKATFVQYAARYAIAGNLSWLFFVGMDYHYGAFSSRNMMEQIRIRDLSGHKIALDGDFLHYDDKGRPLDKESNTLRAAASVYPSVPESEMFNAFLLEKDPHYIYTDLHKAIESDHRERFGETPFAVIGELWMGQDAAIKHGITWKTRSYLRKLDRYLNSIPWEG